MVDRKPKAVFRKLVSTVWHWSSFLSSLRRHLKTRGTWFQWKQWFTAKTLLKNQALNSLYLLFSLQGIHNWILLASYKDYNKKVKQKMDISEYRKAIGNFREGLLWGLFMGFFHFLLIYWQGWCILALSDFNFPVDSIAVNGTLFEWGISWRLKAVL